MPRPSSDSVVSPTRARPEAPVDCDDLDEHDGQQQRPLTIPWKHESA